MTVSSFEFSLKLKVQED
ncbi:Protein of unknown function [Bacillus toyonensis]|uniref:Uncharacterized protein n=1 Tax=Bacillus mycoides TaxID=1405 RepID=A0A1G4EIP5_BACMY|nr:Protein of unknown function [Bacillus mycoides]SCN16996.1 Protein of unknown function [Bacillus toyonensis]